MIEKGEMDEKYKLVTVSLDGTHNLITKAKKKDKKLWSYKLKDLAYNILVLAVLYLFFVHLSHFFQLIMLCNGWWVWVGNPVGASETNDIGLGKREKNEIKDLMEKRDLLICDRGFRALREDICLLCGWTKEKAKSLADWQKKETNEISEQRGTFFVC